LTVFSNQLLELTADRSPLGLLFGHISPTYSKRGDKAPLSNISALPTGKGDNQKHLTQNSPVEERESSPHYLFIPSWEKNVI
jgi:hypothetical protein